MILTLVSNSTSVIIAENTAAIPDSSILSKYVKVTKDEITMLEAPVFKGPAQDAAIAHKIDQLKSALGRLSLVHSHDALVLLKNSLSMPKYCTSCGQQTVPIIHSWPLLTTS